PGRGAGANAARYAKLDRPAHDIGISCMKAADDVDRGRKLDHGSVVAHFPGAKPLAEIAVEIDGRHGCCPLWLEWMFDRLLPRPGIDRVDGAACDISILQCLDVEVKAFDRAQTIGQGAQQRREFLSRILRLTDADCLEPESGSG